MNTEPIYYAIAPRSSKLWTGFVTEETGHDYQSLCSFKVLGQRYGGFCIDNAGKVTFYTADQLENDYDDEYRAYEQMISDRELFAKEMED